MKDDPVICMSCGWKGDYINLQYIAVYLNNETLKKFGYKTSPDDPGEWWDHHQLACPNCESYNIKYINNNKYVNDMVVLEYEGLMR